MSGDVDLAAVGALLADRTRATFLLTLLGGGLTSASALAERADVSRSLASNHLRKLVEGRLIVAEPHGRRRLYRLTSQTIADALEALIPLAPQMPVSSMRSAFERENLLRGRLCYDHLAGRAGVAIADGLVGGGLLVAAADATYSVTSAGRDAFAGLDIDIDTLATRARPLARECPDWSESRAHLAGSLGAALAAEMLRRDWFVTREASRVVTVTATGRDELAERFGIARAQFDLPIPAQRPHEA